jgi:hypothetical protein
MSRFPGCTATADLLSYYVLLVDTGVFKGIEGFYYGRALALDLEEESSDLMKAEIGHL